MTSSTMSPQDVASEPPDDRRYRHGYRPHFPFWLIFPFMFLLFRAPFFWWGYRWYGPNGAYVPGVPGFLAMIPLLVLGFLVLRFALPALDDAVRPLFRSRVARDESDDAARWQRLELDLIDAQRQIRELEEKVAWQSRLLAAQTATPAAAPEPPHQARL